MDRRIAVNTAAGVAGRLGVLALGFVSVAITTRYLGPDGYGRFALVLAITQVFAVVADAGLTTILVRELARAPERAGPLVGSALALRAVLALAAIAAAALAALALPYPTQVRVGVLIAGVPLALGLCNNVFVALAQANLEVRRAAAGDVAGRAAALAAVAAVAALDLGFYAVIAAAGVGAAVTLAVTAWLVRPLMPPRSPASRETARALLGASIPVGVALVLNELYFRADAVIISLSRPFDELGLYSLAWRFSELTATLPAAFLVTVFPLLARTGSGPLLQAAWEVLAVIGLGVAAGGAVLAGALVDALGGGDFAGAADPLRVLLAASALGFVSGVLGHALIAAGHQLQALWLNVVVLALNVAVNVALVPSRGIDAAAWTALGTEAVMLLGSSWLARRHLGFVARAGALVRAVPAAALMAAAVWPLRDGPLWLSLPVGAAVYLAALAALRVLTRERLAALRA